MSWADKTDGAMEACILAFGEQVTYTPSGKSPETIQAIVDMEFQQVDPNTGAIVSSNQPMIGVRNSDLSVTPSEGDVCTVRGLSYRVVERQEDGQAGTRLILHRT